MHTLEFSTLIYSLNFIPLWYKIQKVLKIYSVCIDIVFYKLETPQFLDSPLKTLVSNTKPQKLKMDINVMQAWPQISMTTSVLRLKGQKIWDCTLLVMNAAHLHNDLLLPLEISISIIEYILFHDLSSLTRFLIN